MRHMFGIAPLPHMFRSEALLRGGEPFQYRAATVQAQVSWMKLHRSKCARHAAYADASTGPRAVLPGGPHTEAGPADDTPTQL